MFYETKVIEGVLYYKYSPNDHWIPYTLEELTNMYLTAQSRLNITRDLIRKLNSTLKEYTSWDLK